MAKESFDGNILHFNAVRLRVTGSGNLGLTLGSLDNVNTLALTPLVMATTTNKEPTLLSNFAEQRAFLKIETTAIDEYFNVSKIVIFVKPIASSYPQ